MFLFLKRAGVTEKRVPLQERKDQRKRAGRVNRTPSQNPRLKKKKEIPREIVRKRVGDTGKPSPYKLGF